MLVHGSIFAGNKLQKIVKDLDLVEPCAEPEQLYHQYRREENLLPEILQIHKN